MLSRATLLTGFLAVFSPALLLSTSINAQTMDVPQDSRVFPLGDSGEFEAVPGLTETLVEDVDSEGAIYRYEVPVNWNGDLVMYAHGFRGCEIDPTSGALVPLTVDSPPLRSYFLQQGYAWAASSYAKNCYDVRDGVESTNRLARIFADEVGAPERTLITGFSMGGHVTGAAIELFPNYRCPEGDLGNLCRRFVDVLAELSGGIKYDGAAPMCGVMGDDALFDYFADYQFGAEALAAEVNPMVVSQFPAPDDYATTTQPLTVQALFAEEGAGYPAVLSAQGESLKDLLRVISGGDRPVFEEAFPAFQDLLLSFWGADGTVDGIVSGNIYDNRMRSFQLDGDPEMSSAEIVLNENVLRVQRDPGVNRRGRAPLARIPEITGRLSIPVISVHTLGDLFVPFSMQQIYANDAARFGRSDLLVQRATRAVGHCEFSPDELVQTFADLVTWVEEGTRPAGDDVLDAEAVAEDTYGCTYTAGSTGTTPDILRTGICSAQ
ncbi:MAG: alpha/beta hydrolase [Pseudomonadota bacterium]